MANEYFVNSSDLTSVADAIREKGETTEQLVFPADFVTAIQGIKGGGDLNFEVVGGTTQPSNPKENTIWVNTPNEITGWYFDMFQPSESFDGLVWIRTDEGEAVTINAISEENENSIILRPTEALQYESDTNEWHGLDFQIFIDGVWIEMGGLPSAYQRVEYLQSSGTQWIDTGYTQNANTGYEIKYKFASGDSYQWVFGVLNDDQSKFFGIQYQGGSLFYFNSNSHAYKVSGNDLVDASFAFGVLDVNGVKTAGITVDQITTNRNIVFSAIGMPNGTLMYGKVIVYSFKLTENGAVVRDFIPCYRKSDSVAGMYDLVTRTFFTNAGSGTFTVGGDVE